MKTNNIANVTIGTDPEFFLKKSDGGVVSAIDKIPGSKYEPHKLESGAGLQTDNVAVEFASIAVKDVDDFIGHLRETFEEIKSYIPDGHELVALPSIDFPAVELDHPQAQEFGCSPDMDAWEMKMNASPCPDNKMLRSCGGHLHVGHESLEEIKDKALLVKLMDCFHGLVATILDNSKEANVRRELYGKAGCHRPTTYGVEYRVLSNYWLRHPSLVRLQHSMIHDCMTLMTKGEAEEFVESLGKDTVVQTINNGDVAEAISIVEEVIKPKMSDNSRELFNVCISFDDTTEMAKEWS